MLNKVKERLNSLKVPITDNDDSLLNFSIDRVRNHIKTQTNRQDIPIELNEIAIDMVIGEFLFLKKSMGQLDIETIDFSPFAKQVQDGDTNVIFAVELDGTPESKFNAMIEYLQHNEVDYRKFRRLSW
ncbi:hypothetical protein [Ureibacillus thermosphaericus]|uniref:Phage protein n=1 Tax=Ureibacillus thermosphaericus TaxID=51173 RepID=A0A840PQT0_URETH|nr:hypothetical protein [Ureibacillus thermosphaericus]MBB5148177.1 hypothetical protein [Ureibacillus thermosphaericus]NKZ31087.1 hypothetical protein [Ureibacillus thermosphaericus]